MLIKALMYHDIRDHTKTKFGRLFHKRYELKSFITRDRFIKQIDHIKNHSDIISTPELLQLEKDDDGSYSILTFDDGLLDHYDIQNILLDKQVKGTFLLPTNAISERKIIRSHKIQFILASVDEKEIVANIIDELNDRSLWNTYSISQWKDNWWSREMVFITNVLRKHRCGKTLTDKLFDIFVTSDESAFCDEFYMNVDHITEIINNGMDIGGHGYLSDDLSNMTKHEIANEILESTKFIQLFYNKHRFFSYPNGGCNAKVEKYMYQYKHDLSFTTVQDTFNINNFNHLRVPRYDASKMVI